MNKSYSKRRTGIAGTAAAIITGTALTLGALGATPVNAGLALAAEGTTTTAGSVSTGTAASTVWPSATGMPSADDGAITQVGIAGTYDSATAEAMLARVNEIRAEAHEQGITVDGKVVSGQPLTWSQAYEYVAQVRAAETSLQFSHQRPSTGATVLGDGSSFVDASGTAIVSYAEDIAMASAGMGAEQTLEQWYAEKGTQTAFSSKDSSTGHYVSLISDDYTTIGLGLFEANGGWYLAAELGSNSGASTAVRSGTGVQMVDVANASSDSVSATVTSSSGTSTQGQQLALSLAPGATDALSATVTRTADGTPTDLTGLISLSWSSSDPAVVTVDANGTVTAVAEGTATISLMSGTETLARVSVTVTGNGSTTLSSEASGSGASASDAAEGGSGSASGATEGSATSGTGQVTPLSASADPVTTTAGTAPVLPEAATVAMSDGSVRTGVPVTWANVDQASYASAGTFEVKGTATLDDGQTIEASCTVTVDAAPVTIESANAVAVTTASGSAPELPGAVSVEMSDGSTQEMAVSWEEVDPSQYSAREGTTFVVRGTIEGFDGGVEATVTVEPATAQTASVEGVTTTAGTAPVLPEVAQVSWSNGDVTEEPVSWEEVDEDLYASAGVFEIAGTVTVSGQEASQGATAVNATLLGARVALASESSSDGSTTLPVIATVTVEAAPETTGASGTTEPSTTQEGSSIQHATGADSTAADSSKALDGVSKSVDGPASSSVPSPTAPSSPSDNTGASPHASQASDSSASSNDGETSSSASSTSDVGQSSSPKADGGAAASSKADSSGSSSSKADGGSSSASSAKDEGKAGSSKADGSSTSAGTASSKADSAAASSSKADGSSTSAGSASSEADGGKAGSSAASTEDGGSAASSAGKGASSSAGDATSSSSATSETGKQTPTAVSVASVAMPGAVATQVGIAPSLPATVTATMSDGTTRELAVSWASIDPTSYANAGTFTVDGTVEGYSGTVSVTVVVSKPTVLTYQSEFNVTTPYGTVPTLPTTATVSWSNGSTTNEAITWGSVDSSMVTKSTSGYTFDVTGTLSTGNTVVAHVTVDKASMISQTGDATSALPTVATLAAGVAAVFAAALLAIRRRLGASRRSDR
ncbi:MAG: Ig-like domain-containing protein [Coriobacteriales bacterium]|jgi:hypothetical protein